MNKFYCILSNEGDYVWQEGEESPIVSSTILWASWDGVSSSVSITSGNVPETGIPFLGWPQTGE